MFDRIIDHLASRGDDVAVLTDDRRLTYSELADDVAARSADFRGRRRFVLLETRNDVATLVNYLAALAGDHVVLPVPAGGDHAAIVDAYAPDVIVRGGVIEQRSGTSHSLHPELALLLSTSGSTGSPKLVRLSRANLAANADAIATYLDIVASDRAATTLPMSYCYGLSVIHSHLLRGAGLILTEHSVVDDEFWESMTTHRGTTFAGVPHTFDLLERIGFDQMSLPDLRYVTQAGGRLAPERVRRFAALGRRSGWQLFVMYGATEATARMAYLPPDLACDNPHSIGRPIPGGRFEVEPVHGLPGDVGQLVYHGPNVMMGYAHQPDDLAAGRTVEALRTGDVVRRTEGGLYEVIGRISRFAKLYGLRIDLQRVESNLCRGGVDAICTDGDGVLLVATADRADQYDVLRLAADAAGLPQSAVRILDVDAIPRLPTGKPDYQGVRRLAETRLAERNEAARPIEFDLHGLFGDVLRIDPSTIDPGHSFTDLGGDSLSYVRTSMRLERAIGHLPTDWHRRPLRELQSAPRPLRRWGATLETSVALRAVAIVLVVGSHAGLFTLWGGAHVLLGIAGYNFGRFCLTTAPRVRRVRHLRSTIGWIAVPSVLWVAVALAITDDYTPSNLLLADKFVGPADSMTAGRLWFVELLVWILVALALVCWTPIGDRWERRWPFAFAIAFLVGGLALRFNGFGLGHAAWFTVLAFWFFAIGWAAAKSSTGWQRTVVTVVLAVAVVGYFGNPHRELLVFVGLAMLIWLPATRCPSALTTVASTVAEASLFIYLTHYQVYPLFGGHHLLGVTASIVVGILLTQSVTMLRKRTRLAGSRAIAATPAPARR